MFVIISVIAVLAVLVVIGFQTYLAWFRPQELLWLRRNHIRVSEGTTLWINRIAYTLLFVVWLILVVYGLVDQFSR